METNHHDKRESSTNRASLLRGVPQTTSSGTQDELVEIGKRIIASSPIEIPIPKGNKAIIKPLTKMCFMDGLLHFVALEARGDVLMVVPVSGSAYPGWSDAEFFDFDDAMVCLEPYATTMLWVLTH